MGLIIHTIKSKETLTGLSEAVFWAILISYLMKGGK
ncbi:hypothetical protein ES702_00355 [subsurface metagenome]